MKKINWRPLAALFFTYHLLAITTYSFTSEGRGQSLRLPFKTYISLFSLKQGYNMFVDHHPWPSATFVVIAENGEKQQKAFGPLLPGLREFGEGSHRTQKLFGRMFDTKKSNKVSLQSYAGNICREISASTTFKPESIYLRMVGTRNNALVDIRKGGPAQQPAQRIQGPIACD